MIPGRKWVIAAAKPEIYKIADAPGNNSISGVLMDCWSDLRMKSLKSEFFSVLLIKGN